MNKMGFRGWAKRRDKNEPEIIAALENLGYFVIPQDKPVDLLCAKRGKWVWVEVKSSPSEKLTPDQQRFFALATLVGAPCSRIDVVEDCLIMDRILFPTTSSKD